MNKITFRIRQLLRDSKKSIMWTIIASMFFGGMMVAIYPTMKDSSADLAVMMESLPPEMFEVFGIQELDFGIFENFISSEYLNFLWAVIFFPFIINWAATIGREFEDGTFGLLLSQSISRRQAILGSILDGFLKSFLLSTIIVGGVVLLTLLFDIDLVYKNWIILDLLIASMMAAIYQLTIFICVITGKRSTGVGISSTILLGGYFINIVAKLYDKVEFIKYVSPFYYYGNPVDLLLNGTYEMQPFVVFLSVALVAAIGSYYMVDRTDVPTG